MSLAGLLTILDDDPQLHGVVSRADAEPVPERASAGTSADGQGPALAGEDLVAPPTLRPVLAAALARGHGGAPRFVLAVTATAKEADDLAAALGSFLPPDSVAYFPGWETLPHERLSPRLDTVGQRIAVLRRLAHPAADGEPNGPLAVVATPVRSLLQPIVAGLGDLEPVALQVGQSCELDDMLARLVEIGYSRTDMVGSRGEIAVRGGIVDVFPPTEEHPLRVEFFGDTVEEIRYFKVADQRSIGPAERGLWAPPCRELLLTPAVRQRAKELADTHPALADILGKVAEGIAVEGMEAFAPVLAERMELLLDYVPAGGIVLACDPERVRARAEELVRTSQEFLEASWVNAAMRGEGEVGGEVPVDLGPAAFQPIARIRAAAAALGVPWWTIAPFGVTDSEPEPGAVPGQAIQPNDLGEPAPFRINASLAPSYRGDTARMIADVRGWLTKGWRVVLVTEGHGPAQRLAEMLRGEGVGARMQDDVDDPPEAGVPYVTTARIGNGFVWPSVRVALLTESDLAGHPAGLATTKDMRRMPSRRRGGVDPLQLKPGDYVVHEQHGVGRYVEMTSRTAAGATREYLVIEYAPGKRGQPPDRLYVPTDQLDEVTRYSGGEAPTLHRLGGADWAKAKGRARKAVRQIASELIRLYSARMASPGFAFGPDTPWQRELEDAFPYVETPDQLGAIDEVKHDMERPVPMDRLICGDVGYGKTEIAVRAAFKAVQDGKQVAVLVPTTLLVQQHFSTFSERYAPFPVTVKPLSRFQGSAETAETLRGLADGTVDVVIGTHKLLSPETRLARLGLVIIDEEQRFGVEHKEYLKRLRTEVDVLGMSATPIPRTLEMGVAGIREMSTILTPPEERHPVLTFVGAYDDKQVAAAIRRELLRDGQVFFVHNRVSSIRKVAAQIAEFVPEARIAVAHGQMNEHELEKIMVDFWERNYDVLVATTIVESGLDIPNANTLIIDRADMYGLSQLHQLRGRVGRGSERAYAYFLYPPERALTETAHERLATVAQHTEVGAGMYVAMKDLEIRGAGNLLGGEQSGHIAGVGFDLYVRMIGEAVNELKGDGPAEKPEVRVELPVNAHIPHDYVPGERLRLEAYTRIAAIDSEEDATAVRDELTDRYGEPPEPVLNLLEVARLRTAARRAGLTDITMAGQHIRFAPVELPDSRQVRVQRLYPKTVLKPAVRTMLVPVPKTAAIGGQPLRDTELLAWCGEVIRSVLADLAVGVLFDEWAESGAAQACQDVRRRARRRAPGDRVQPGEVWRRGDHGQPADHDRDPHHRGHQPQPDRQAVPGHDPDEFGAGDAGDAHLAGPVPDQRGTGPPGRHHGHSGPGAEGAGPDLRDGQGQRGGPGAVERHPRPHPGRQRDPAEPVRRGRPLPGHPGPVHPAGQRRHDAHDDRWADGRHRQAPACPVPGGQVPGDKDQPAVRPVQLHPVSGRPRAQPGGGVAGTHEGDPVVRADAGLLTVLVTSPRVAPGLLSWSAWQALRAASVVLAPVGHPQLPALDEAGIGYRVVDDSEVESLDFDAELLACAGDVVWLPEPGAEPPLPPGARLLHGSADLSGARFLDLVATMDRLRVECPWDARQTHASLAPHLLEEPYEALEALESGDDQALCEELGDVLLQVVFHARIAAERDDGTSFTVDDVADGIVAKLVRRHPHVFADVAVSGAEDVKRNWDEIKREEKRALALRRGAAADGPEAPSALDGVPFGQPALALAAQLQRRAARAGVPEELARLDGEPGSAGSADSGSAESGDPGQDIGRELFRLVVKARAAGRDPEMELREAARRYRDLVHAWERS